MTHLPATGTRAEAPRGVARFFVEHPQIGWTLLIATMLLGLFAYRSLPKRKDPFLPARVAVVTCLLPGASALEVEGSLTKTLEQTIAASEDIEHIESSSRSHGVSLTVTLREGLNEAAAVRALDAIDARLRALEQSDRLVKGAGPIVFHRDFGDTATVVLALSSGALGDVELDVRAREIREALVRERGTHAGNRAALVLSGAWADTHPPPRLEALARTFAELAEADGAADVVVMAEASFVAVDATFSSDGARIWRDILSAHASDELGVASLPLGAWAPLVVDDPATVRDAIELSSPDRYDEETLVDQAKALALRLRSVPRMGSVSLAAAPELAVTVRYSDARLAATGTRPETLRAALRAFDIPAAGGTYSHGARTVGVSASAPKASARALAATPVALDADGRVVHLADVATVDWELDTRAAHLAYRRSAASSHRGKTIAIVLRMKADEQIDAFEESLAASLVQARADLPEGMTLERVSDQPAQVREKLSLLTTSLYEAILLILAVALVGYRGWRMAAVLALSIPATLALTFVFMAILKVDLQQVSIASLILALGLLIDDPVVAADAIEREVASGHAVRVAAWLGPTKLARAIFYATATNLAAYLPLLMLTGDVGRFVYSLPLVVASSLIASRIVSMTFVPLFGVALLRPKRGPIRLATAAEGARIAGSRWSAFYRRALLACLARRRALLAGAALVLALMGLLGLGLRNSLFPRDGARTFVIDVTLPEDSSLSATAATVLRAEAQVFYGQESAGARAGQSRGLVGTTAFVGGGAPRFWYSLAPRARQQNLGQIVVEVADGVDTVAFGAECRRVLSATIAGARFDVRHLENGKSGAMPIELRVVGEDSVELRKVGDALEAALLQSPGVQQPRDDWGSDGLRLAMEADERASANGVTNADVAEAVVAATQGLPLGTIQTRGGAVPILGRSTSATRPQDISVRSNTWRAPLPLSAITTSSLRLEPEVVARRDQVRTLTVSALVAEGYLASDGMAAMRAALSTARASLPAGYRIEVGGEEADFLRVRGETSLVAVVSLVGIGLLLLFSFRKLAKVALVLAAVPFGLGGGMVFLRIAGAPLGFMAMVGLVSLGGVIVSHIIVLFEYLEEAEARGEVLEEALAEAGAQRARPVLVTVAATVLGLVPLAIHGGALWQPLCYAQIGGLIVATGITLGIVPLLLAVCVRDLRCMAWAPLASVTEARLGGDETTVVQLRRRHIR